MKAKIDKMSLKKSTYSVACLKFCIANWSSGNFPDVGVGLLGERSLCARTGGERICCWIGGLAVLGDSILSTVGNLDAEVFACI